MDTGRPQKKTETLEVRLPHDTKRAFLDACREDGTTASEVVRGSIQTYLDDRAGPERQSSTGRLIAMIPKPVRKVRYLAGAAGAIGLTVFAVLPSAAGPDFRAVFDRLDADGDGILTPEEFNARSGGNAEEKELVFVRKVEKDDGQRDVAPPPHGLSEKAVAYWLGDSGETQGEDGHVVIERREIRIVADADTGDVTTIDIRKSDFEQYDADKDGKVSFAEYQARHRQMLEAGFHELDADGDGALNEAEYGRIGQPRITWAPSPETQKVVTETIEGGPLVKPEDLKAQFAKLDANRDGKLSMQEYLPRE